MTSTVRLIGSPARFAVSRETSSRCLPRWRQAREGEVLWWTAARPGAALWGTSWPWRPAERRGAASSSTGRLRDLVGLEGVGIPSSPGRNPAHWHAEHLLESQVRSSAVVRRCNPGISFRRPKTASWSSRPSASDRSTARRPGDQRNETEVARRLRRGRPLAELMRLFDRLIELRKRD